MARFFRSFPITQSRFAIPFGIRFPAVVVSAVQNLLMLMGVGV